MVKNRRGSALVGVLIILVVIGAIAGGIYWVYYQNIGVWQGVNYKVDAMVVRVEESTKFYPHTYVDVKINEYTSATYLLYGTGLGIKINNRYHLEWTSGTVWRWDSFWWDVIGYPTNISLMP